jgi:hypothetical protein
VNDPEDSALSGNLLQEGSKTSDKQSEEKPEGNKGMKITDLFTKP